MEQDQAVLTVQTGGNETKDAPASLVEDHSLPAEEVLKQQRLEQRAADPGQVFIP